MSFISQIHAQEDLGTIGGLGTFHDIDPTQAPTIFETLASSIFGFLTLVAGLAFILYFVLGAINWITSGGEEARVEKAKNQMTSAAIGLIIVVAAYTVIGIVGTVVGFDILNPASVFSNIVPGA